jgi:hypothetical protein
MMNETSRRLAGTGKAIKLPKLALDIIAKQPRFQNNPCIFAGSTGNPFGQRSWELDEQSLGVSIGRRTMSVDGTKPHVLLENSFGDSERVMGHEKKGVDGIYDQWEYFLRK